MKTFGEVKTVCVGIIGSGTMGHAHFQAWTALGVQVFLFSQDLASAEQLAQGTAATVCPSMDELLAQVDIVDVCVPTFAHREVVELAARAGRHVVCEKPLALSLEDGAAMVAACEAAGVRLFVAMVLRFFPQYRAAYNLVKEGQVGSPQVLRLKRVSSPPYGGTSWYSDESRSGGMVLDLMLHDIDYALWCAGDVERVYSKVNVVGPRQYAQAVLTHRSGAISLIESGWAYPQGMFRTSLDIAGSTGVIEWTSDAPPTVRSYLQAKSERVQGVGLPSGGAAEDPFTLEMRHVMNALRSGTPFDVTPREAMVALEVALAVKTSARTGVPVVLGESA
ncbi:Gfo/Idh/MocA family protein [Deinococcus hopiensis]|uniref:Predicted dehydrogenase n=1 Tax=Deinococcus hopiensis KR-140 TaxID=695939 RepID=A0A1W1ULX4_9DEIO|nr:Gfo/Idh/MocA family oxidoreductase [Deinococcus hopiensis]SMB81724.1 Predicted dehydrogenase [Deinococcus hopiensis KR-140]